MLSHSTIIQFELLKSRFLVWSISETFANDLDNIFDGFLMTAHDVLFFSESGIVMSQCEYMGLPVGLSVYFKRGGVFF